MHINVANQLYNTRHINFHYVWYIRNAEITTKNNTRFLDVIKAKNMTVKYKYVTVMAGFMTV